MVKITDSGVDFGNRTKSIDRSSLSKKDRKAYTDAVLCLMERPALSDPAEIPGARSRYDDFVGVHIQQTTKIHGTVSETLSDYNVVK